MRPSRTCRRAGRLGTNKSHRLECGLQCKGSVWCSCTMQRCLVHGIEVSPAAHASRYIRQAPLRVCPVENICYLLGLYSLNNALPQDCCCFLFLCSVTTAFPVAGAPCSPIVAPCASCNSVNAPQNVAGAGPCVRPNPSPTYPTLPSPTLQPFWIPQPVAIWWNR